MPLAAIAFSILISANQQLPEPWLTVQKVVGVNGSVNKDGSFRININRTDVKFESASGMSISADLGLATYIAFSDDSNDALAVGDIALLRTEIDPVIDRLRRADFQIVSLHNHMTAEEPRLFFLHFIKKGSPEQIARSFKRAIDVLGKPTPTPLISKPGKVAIPTPELESILQAKADVKPSGVVRFGFPRTALNVKVEGTKFTPGMGLGCWSAFYACECGKTMVMGDTCCTKAELQPAIDALRAGGISITAIHNHTLGASEEIIFMHFEGEGESTAVAKTIRSCWDKLKASL